MLVSALTMAPVVAYRNIRKRFVNPGRRAGKLPDDAAPNVSVMPRKLIVSVEGTERLEKINLRDRESSEEPSIGMAAMFVFIGAAPHTGIVADIVEQGQQEGAIRKDLYVGLVKRFIIGAVDEVINTWIHADEDYDLVSMADPLVDLFIKGIGTEWDN